MGSLISQITTVIKMNVASLPQRGWMAAASLLAIAIVVAVLLAFLAMANGFQSTVKNSGSEALGIALRAGSRAELNSGLGAEQVKLLEEAPGIKREGDSPITSAELYVIVDGKKKTTGTDANLSLRGIGEDGIALRPMVRLDEGRWFVPGKNEVVVGRGVNRDFENFAVGSEIKLGTATWTVVGIFSANGSVYESELWTDVRTVQTQFNRGNSFQTFRFALASPGDLSAIKSYVEGNPQLNVDVFTEQEYFADQAKDLSNIIFFIGWPLAIIMALGALSGALNSMYASVSQRTREIATLRALGFSGISAFFGTQVEALVLAFLGGIVGTTAAYLFFNGMTASTLGGSFTQIVFKFEITLGAFQQGIILALVVGLVGGFFPALRAARVPVLKAFSLDDR